MQVKSELNLMALWKLFLPIGIPSGCFANQTNGEHTLTEDNLEIVMQTNYFGHFLLTNLLKDALKKSSDARVVNLSSIYYILGEIKLTNLNGENFFSNQQVWETYNSESQHALYKFWF